LNEEKRDAKPIGQEINKITYENYIAYVLWHNMYWAQTDEENFKLYAKSPL
jgi:hypothetical protein